MKTNVTIFIVLLAVSLLGFGCSKETVDPHLTGSIEGVVQRSDTGKPVSNASITTNPGTDALLTDQNGEFIISDVATGSYTIQVEKDSFITKTVRVSVEENRVASAQIMLKRDDNKENVSSLNNIKVEINHYENFNYGPRDSFYVYVDYRFENISATERVGNYEVYFKIFTRNSVFYQEVRGDSLDAGEQSVGTFEKYIYRHKADSVNVSGIYAQTM